MTTSSDPRRRDPRILIVATAPEVVETRAESAVVSSVAEASIAATDGEWDAFFVDAGLLDGAALGFLATVRSLHPEALILVTTADETKRARELAFVHEQTMMARQPEPPPLAALAARLSALGLTPRETELFVELATGTTAEVVALRFNISAATVRSHCRRVYTRLGTSSLAEVIARAQGWR
jgi:DNA-binding NarL/FixJ family response regulator